MPTVEYISLKMVGAIICFLTFFPSSQPIPITNGRAVNYSAPPVSSAFFLTLPYATLYSDLQKAWYH